MSRGEDTSRDPRRQVSRTSVRFGGGSPTGSPAGPARGPAADARVMTPEREQEAMDIVRRNLKPGDNGYALPSVGGLLNSMGRKR